MTDVTEAKISLLLNESLIHKENKSEVLVFGKKAELEIKSNGIYIYPLLSANSSQDSENVLLQIHSTKMKNVAVKLYNLDISHLK